MRRLRYGVLYGPNQADGRQPSIEPEVWSSYRNFASRSLQQLRLVIPLIGQALEQLIFELAPIRRVTIDDDLKAAVTPPGRGSAMSRILGSINHPPILTALKYSLQANN